MAGVSRRDFLQQATKIGGLKNYFVENSWDVTVRSVAFLKTLNVA